MTLRHSMGASMTPFLGPGETVDVVFGAMARNPLTAALAVEFGLGHDPWRWRIVAVTPQRILVLDAGPSGRTATGVLAELPRSRRLGAPFGLLMHVIPLAAESLRVPRRFFKDIKAADSLMKVGS
jgi:hypothetical protein